MFRVLVLSFVMALGCGASGATAGGVSDEGASAGAVSDERAGDEGSSQEPIRTPTSFAACQALAIRCGGPEAPPSCAFPEGTCTCEVHHRCSGVPPGPGERVSWRQWSCRPTPPAFRADGCPGTEPTDRAACDGRARRCSYGECAFVPYECVDGTWRRGMASAPPSAAP